MRQLWARLLMVAAAISVITLAASSPIYSAASSGSAGADCSEATARQVVEQHPEVNIFILPDPVRGVLCGPFTGAGSNAMAITIGAPTCWPIQNWAVFRFNQGEWELVLNQPAYLVPPLVAVGSDIRETTAVARPGDPRCFPTGGTHARTWHWDGTRFTAGPWTQVTAGEPLSKMFHSPSRNITCWMDDDSKFRGVGCSSAKPPRRVNMDVDGRLRICRGTRCVGCGCDPPDIFVLGYGRQATVGRFRCLSQRSGVTCTVIRSGRGFLISRTGVRRVGP